AGIRSIEIPVLDLESRKEEVAEALASESQKLVDDYNADSIILGCTGLVGMAREVQRRVGVPVLDPTPIAVKYADLLVTTGTTHSPRAFPKPPTKLRKFPEGLNLGSAALLPKA
ncbi:MAG TPA: aspartate/glutamate racemase family protein, partial [Nitrososphaerales archaeon]|nr:aspartate/glutamate racemase family protein [Nitrososphaerales archaeon]